ncbi:hypothetical protein [Halalkalibacter nanhaiisediminis]|uniref:Uncharacterized protein n=1 Tax=Halalkalibacter nanhaiisediminis TaxID=688079 RepID=A0A562QTG6_9BACI|nr:hypothetical protein [Halalkalibacter nanhaiisediminis]TWI60035.1 hypothetical protein IQ10_00459 [Halalkalibacter nanhaiisediminis]
MIFKKLFLAFIFTIISLHVTGCGMGASPNGSEQDINSETPEQNEQDLSSHPSHDLPFHELINKIIEDGHKIALVGDSEKYNPPSKFQNSVENIDIENITSEDYLAIFFMSDQLQHLDNSDVLELVESGTSVFFEREPFSIEKLMKWIENKEIPAEMAEMGESRKDEDIVYVSLDAEEGIIIYGAMVLSEDESERLTDLYEQILYASYKY